MATDQEIADVLNSGGAGCPAFKFKAFGDKIIGTVTRRKVVESTNLSDSTQMTTNLVLDVTSDEPITQVQSDGTSITGTEWSLWFKAPSQALTALSAEIKARGGSVGAPREGDRVGVEYYGAEKPQHPGHSPKKLHKVQYKPAAPTLVSSASDLL